MPIEFRSATLDNGLTVVAEIDPAAHSSGIGFFVKTGARDETPAEMGVSHFLEHMMFKGTERRKAEDVDRDFDDIGARHNAFTTSEMTAFWAHCLPEHLPRSGEILADILRPALRPDDFDDEKGVILEEIAMYRDYPYWELYERSMEAYYGAHPLAHRVLGTEETVGAMQRDAMERYFRDRYSADNTVVAMAGRLDFDAMVEHVRALCAGWTRTDTARSHAPFVPRPASFTMESDQATVHYILMMAPAPSITDERRYAAGLLTQILGDTDGSRLYWALIDTGLAEETQAQHVGRDGLGDYMVYCSCAPERAEEVERIALDEIDRLAASITQDDLDRARSRSATSITLHGERPAGRMKRLGQVWTYTGSYRALDDELARLQAVTLEEIRAVAEAFPLAPIVCGRLTPKT